MALTSILKEECPTCHKQAVEKSRLKIGQTTFITLMCGHSIAKQALGSGNVYDTLISSDGKRPREYQLEGIRFGEAADANFILADEQGLGKTIQALCLLKLHPEKLLPAIIEVPTTVKLQWLLEILRWCCPNGTKEEKQQFLTQVIQSGKEKAMPGFQIYIVTFDMLKKADMFEYIPDIKTIIIDECQRIKNHLSDRAKAVQQIVETKQIKHVIPMSGTPIKNHAGEYFTVLNLVDRRRFPQYQRYLDNYCDSYFNGWGNKVGGLKNPEVFHEDTKDIILRRTKAEVLKDLPALDRKFYHVELDRKLNKAYAKALEELDEAMYDDEVNEFDRNSNMLAIMAKLRHITGVSKVAECVDFVTEFLMSSDRKITIFVHHQDVAQLLLDQLTKWCEEGGFAKPLSLTSSLSGDARQALVMNFKDESLNHRILIASTLAAGEGLNLQFCSDAILLERQWNPANEEQAEGRFHRFGQMNPVSVTYMIASETIDEYFTELVESKRAIVASTLDNKEIAWEQNSLMKELATVLTTKGRNKWTL